MYTEHLTGSFLKQWFLLDFWTTGIEIRLSAVSAQKGERERDFSDVCGPACLSFLSVHGLTARSSALSEEKNNGSKTAGNRKTKPSYETWPIKHTYPRCLTGEAAVQILVEIPIGVCMGVLCLSGEVFVCVWVEGKHLSLSLLGQKGNTLRNRTGFEFVFLEIEKVLQRSVHQTYWATAKTGVSGDGIYAIYRFGSYFDSSSSGLQECRHSRSINGFFVVKLPQAQVIITVVVCLFIYLIW